jgi:tetratricopeptide (TPR) repeat protein
MIPEWLSEPERPQPQTGGGRAVSHKVTSARAWWLRVGLVIFLVGAGSAAVFLLNPSSIKARVLMSIAGTYSREEGGYAFLKKHCTASDTSAAAVATCENLVRLKPTDASAHALLGDAYAEGGRVAEATAAYHEALALEPDCFEAHLGLGKMHVEVGHYVEAVECYRRALRIRPDSADAHLSLALALSNLGKYDEAMQAFQRAKELDPGIAETQVLTGKSYLQARMYPQAIECFKDAIGTDRGHAQAYFNLGRAYLRVGDRALAMEQQHLLQNLDPRLAEQLLLLIQNP